MAESRSDIFLLLKKNIDSVTWLGLGFESDSELTRWSGELDSSPVAWAGVFIWKIFFFIPATETSVAKPEISVTGRGARFSKAPETFRTRKAIAKCRTVQLQSCVIHVFLISTQVPLIQEVSGVYTSPFLDTDEQKFSLRARKVFGAFEKRAPARLLIWTHQHFFLQRREWRGEISETEPPLHMNPVSRAPKAWRDVSSN